MRTTIPLEIIWVAFFSRCQRHRCGQGLEARPWWPEQGWPWVAALLSAAALHPQEPLLYYLVYNTEPKFGMAAALESVVAPAMTLPPEELAALCASPIAMQLERTSLGQRLGKPAALQAARARVDADHFLSESKLELADRVITSIRPRLGVASGPAGAAALPPASREDFVDTKFLQFVRDQQEWLLAHAELDARLEA